MDNTRGFSRETFIGITPNLESQEFRRRQNSDIGFEEHPRAGTSDDLEALFAVYHRDLGVIFTLKEFKYNWKNLAGYTINCTN